MTEFTEHARTFRNAILSVKGDPRVPPSEYFTVTRLTIERHDCMIPNSNAVMKNECRVGVDR